MFRIRVVKWLSCAALVLGIFLVYVTIKQLVTDRSFLEAQGNAVKRITKTTESFDAGKRFQKRRAHLQEKCQALNATGNAYGPDESSHLDHLIYNDEKKVLYCFVPKVACTNFKRVFLAQEGVVGPKEAETLTGYEVHVTYQDRLGMLGDLPLPERERRLRTYRKFLFVREPFERFLSAYRNKFFHPNPRNVADFIGWINAFYVKHPRFPKRVKNNTISLSHFILHVANDRMKAGSLVNEHFSPVWKLCHPCDVDYDYIGKYESLDDDVRYIFDQLHIDIPFPARADNYSVAQTKNLVEATFRDVPKSLRILLWKFMQLDYTLLGYDKPDFL